MVLTHNMELSLTQSLKRSEQLDGMCTPSQSPRRSVKEEEEEEEEEEGGLCRCFGVYAMFTFIQTASFFKAACGGTKKFRRIILMPFSCDSVSCTLQLRSIQITISSKLNLSKDMQQ